MGPSNTTTTTSKSLRVSTAPNRKNGKQGSLCNVLRPSRRLLRPGDLLHRGQPVLSQPGLLQPASDQVAYACQGGAPCCNQASCCAQGTCSACSCCGRDAACCQGSR